MNLDKEDAAKILLHRKAISVACSQESSHDRVTTHFLWVEVMDRVHKHGAEGRAVKHHGGHALRGFLQTPSFIRRL
jgi:hypothetical protein